MNKIYFFLSIILLQSLNAKSQNWKTYLNANQQVSAVEYQAPYLWMGTSYGLYRENVLTKQQIVFDISNSPLQSNQITQIAIQGDKVWVGSTTGLACYENETWTVPSAYQDGITSFSIIDSNVIWVGGLHSFARYDGISWETFGTNGVDGIPYPDPSNPLLHVGKIVQHDNATWILTMELGILKYKNGVFSSYIIPGHAGENIYESNIAVVNNGLVVGSNMGTYLINTSTNQATTLINGRISTNLFSNGGDSFWSYNNADNGMLKVLPTGDTLHYKLPFKDIVEFPNGDYVAASTNGLIEKKGNALSVRKLIPEPDIPSFSLKDMVTDTKNNLWMATFGGLVKKEGETWSVIDQGLTAIGIEDLEVDKNGNVWAATSGGGIGKIDTNRNVSFFNTSNSTLPGNFINHLAFDKNGNLWAALGNGDNDVVNNGNYRGVCKITFANGIISNVMAMPSGGAGPSAAYPTDMIVDNNSMLWLSYYGHLSNPWQPAVPALSKYDGTTWTHYNFSNTNLQSFSTQALALDKENELYLYMNDYFYNNTTGQFKAALVKFNGMNSVVHTTPPEWSSFYASDVQIDKNDVIWLSSQKGVSSFSPITQTWNTFDAQNSPLPKEFINSYETNVFKIAIDNNNTKYFNCANGFLGKDGIAMYNENGLDLLDSLLDQAISFKTIPDKIFGDNSFELEATANSGLPVAFYTGSNKIQIDNNMVTILNAGWVNITAFQSGNNQYHAAPDVAQGFCINPAKPIVTAESNAHSFTLTSNAVSGNIWYKDNVILGSNANSITITDPGVYKVRAQADDCLSDFSDGHAIYITGTERGTEDEIKLFPNPAYDRMTVSFGTISGAKTIAIYQTDGKMINSLTTSANETQINTSNYTPGLYLVRVSTENSVQSIRFIKK